MFSNKILAFFPLFNLSVTAGLQNSVEQLKVMIDLVFPHFMQGRNIDDQINRVGRKSGELAREQEDQVRVGVGFRNFLELLEVSVGKDVSLRKQPRKISFRYPKRGRNIHGYVSEVGIHFQNHKSIPTVSSTQFENRPLSASRQSSLERFIFENGIPKILRNTHAFSGIGEGGATEFGFS